MLIFMIIHAVNSQQCIIQYKYNRCAKLWSILFFFKNVNEWANSASPFQQKQFKRIATNERL